MKIHAYHTKSHNGRMYYLAGSHKKGHDHMFCRFVDINFYKNNADIEKKCANSDCCKLSQRSAACVVEGRKLNWRATLPGSKRGRKTKEIKKHQIRYFALFFFKQ